MNRVVFLHAHGFAKLTRWLGLGFWPRAGMLEQRPINKTKIMASCWEGWVGLTVGVGQAVPRIDDDSKASW
jgi:hypothetical protein